MRVFSNLAVSIDGKIADRNRPTQPLGTPYDRRTMAVVRRDADVIVVGANTLRAHPKSFRVKGPGGKKSFVPVNAVLTASGELDPKMPFWEESDVIRFVFTTKRGFERALENVRDRAFVVVAGEDKLDPKAVLDRLKASDLHNVLIEGGGETVALFLEAKLLQEMYVTITPWILGGRENPSLTGGEGLVPWTKLKIHKMKRVKEEIYLHLKVKGARRV